MQNSTNIIGILGRPSTAIPLMYTPIALLSWVPIFGPTFQSTLLIPTLPFMIIIRLFPGVPPIIELPVAYILALTFWTMIGAILDWRVLKQDADFRRRFRSVAIISYILTFFGSVINGLLF